MTVRLAHENRPDVVAMVAQILAEEGVQLGPVELVAAEANQVIRDLTFEVADEAQTERVLTRLRTLPFLRLLSGPDRLFQIHHGGKIAVQSKLALDSPNVLSLIYTPGVGRVAKAIAQEPAKVYQYTTKGNSVAIVTDGSAVLGLGNLGPEAALPVMEGKAVLFKELAGIDAWPLCLSTQDPDEIVRTVQAIAPTFGGIQLEDISAPRCFAIEQRLIESLDIPVMHDDQHATAVVILAALTNALTLVGKSLDQVRIVVNGLGAAGLACCRMLLAAGVRHLVGCGRQGIILSGPPERLLACREDLLACLERDRPLGTLQDALKGADVFIGLSSANILTPADLDLMAPDRIVFAMANPDPEIKPELARGHCRIFATGRSDYPNQINNALAFPGIFRGALDVQACRINDAMKVAAARAIAAMVRPEALSEECIVPSVFDRRVVSEVALAVAKAARETGVARAR
jgi:malate dehydrogenase (oxaloacetate-decarboxylating)